MKKAAVLSFLVAVMLLAIAVVAERSSRRKSRGRLFGGDRC